MRKHQLGGAALMVLALVLVASPAGARRKHDATPPAGQAENAAPAAGAKVDINNATEKDLEALPGVGKATAKKIIAGRPYSSVADLSKAGVSAKTIDKITPLVTVGAAAAPAAPPPAAVHPTPPAAAPKAAPAGTGSAATAQPPPQPGMVWVNLDSKVFHEPGSRWYGETKNGKYMTEADALAAGYRPAKTHQKKQ